jgi:hypothetical protein
MAAIYIIQRKDVPNLKDIKETLEKYCAEIVVNDHAVMFLPKDGFLATLGLYFSERAISYHLEFMKQ